jgi:hypothetical protein
MRQYVAKLSPAFLLGGCSLLYNPSNIGKAPIDGQVVDVEMTADARIDAPPLFDADPSMLTLEDVAPNFIYEGQGQGGSRQALLVIRGHHIIAAGLSVAITPSTGLTLGTPTRSMNGDFIALPITVAIDTNANTGSTPLSITVMQSGGPPGGVTLSGKLELRYLPQFPTGTTIAAASLAPLYSEVNTASNITITGSSSEPALIHSVSQIKIGNINVSGAAASGNTLGAGGPGGCPGGANGATGGCTQNDGGGGGSSGNGGGGGGGFSSTGGTGNGGGGGTAGVAHGNVQIVNYGGADGAKNQSAGGGGGGAMTLSSAGAGGGGGGTLELTAGGNIQVGTITANGGKGGDAGTLITGAGGGGGGSGGVVVLRSDAGMIATGAISATGGAAGAAAGSGGGGGMGASGRVRVDIPIPNASLPAANPASRRGPSFAMNTPTIVTGETNVLTVFGATDDIVDAYVIDANDLPHFGEPMNLKFVNGALTFAPALLPGYNRLCVTLRPGTRGETLADKCIDIAYLP